MSNRYVKFDINSKDDFITTINIMFEAAKKEWNYDIIDYIIDILPFSIENIDDWRRIMNVIIPLFPQGGFEDGKD